MVVRSRLIYLFVIVLFFIAFFGIYYYLDTKNISSLSRLLDSDAISFNLDSGFYDESITIRINKDFEIPKAAKLYYTLNGDDPDLNSNLYQSGIDLSIENTIKMYPLKVSIYYEGEFSDTYERVYIIGKDVLSEYNIDVISITSDSDNLYDYYTGILVPGYIYDQNYANGETVGTRGNYNMRTDEWIRDANIVMFDSNGELLIEQKVGLAVSGGSSPAFDIKSFKIYAGEEYDLNNKKINIYNLYNKEYSSLSFVSKYNSIRLRSGSQDMFDTNIRSSLISRLSEESNFDGYSQTKRVLVYLNGEAYGVFDMQQNYSNSFLANRFSLDDSNSIEKYKGNETNIFDAFDLSKYFDLDLNDKENRILLEEHVDMDNYLLYYAIEVLAGNVDWPMNSFQAWRYNGEYDSSNKYTDGRVRFLIYDVDLTYYSYAFEWYEDCDQSLIKMLMEESSSRTIGTTFTNVMESKYYRDKFITLVLDLLNTSFKEDNILQIVDEEYAKIRNTNTFINGTDYTVERDENIERFKEKIKTLDEEIINAFEYYFEVDTKYTFNISNSLGITSYWNNLTFFGGESYTNKYYDNLEFSIYQEAYPGYEFKYWLVNDKKYYDEILTVTNEMIVDDEINVQLIAEPIKEESLIISEISAKSSTDWIKLYNASQEEIQLNNYYLTDNDNLYRYQLPNVILNPGEYIVINGKDNYYSLGDYICNFNLNDREIIYLSKNGVIVDEVSVPKMSEYETYGRYLNSNIFVYFDNYNGSRKDL